MRISMCRSNPVNYQESTWLSIEAGMAELADAADLKSAALKRSWGFESPSRHQNIQFVLSRLPARFFHVLVTSLNLFRVPNESCDSCGSYISCALAISPSRLD